MRQKSTISKRGEGAPARKEQAYWGIYTLPDLVVSEEKTRIERETFDFSSAVPIVNSFITYRDVPGGPMAYFGAHTEMYLVALWLISAIFRKWSTSSDLYFTL